MRIQLVETYKQPKKYTQYIVITVVILILIAVCVLGIIGINEKKQTNLQPLAEIEEKNDQEKQEEVLEVVEGKKLPVLTEIGIQNIENIYKSEEKVAYLTFDDGPSKSVTPLILDVLKNNNIKATFFVLGSRVELSPDIVKRAYEEGHYIANHGYSHIYKKIYASPQSVLDEVIQTNNAIKNAIGEEYEPHLFRFPGGSKGNKYEGIIRDAIEVLKNNQIAYLDWNALSGDSEGKKTKEAMFQRVVETVQGKNSIVILMHDASDKILTYEVLQDVINYLKEQGYRFGDMYDVIK